MYSYSDVLKETLIDEETLQGRIKELAAQLDKDFADKDVVLVCFLRGGVVFLVDLMREMKIPHQIEFMALSSYGVGKRESEGNVRISYAGSTDLKGKDIIIVEDIIDSGNTLHAAIPLLLAQEPNSLCVCTLLNKSSRRTVEIPELKYVGFDIEDKFVYGYGLDLDDYFRNLNFVGVVDEKKLKEFNSKQD